MERVNVSRSDTAYAASLTRLWSEQRRFLNIEHDIEIHSRVMSEAEYCPYPWCTWPYNGPGIWTGDNPLIYNSLGCTKFSGQLMRDEPDLLGKAASTGRPPNFSPGDWNRMDAEVSPLLLERGYKPHYHYPAVEHHHVYQGHGCACGGQH